MSLSENFEIFINFLIVLRPKIVKEIIFQFSKFDPKMKIASHITRSSFLFK